MNARIATRYVAVGEGTKLVPRQSVAHDCPVAERLVRRIKPSKRMLGDAAYDSAELREELDENGTKSVIQNRCNRQQPFTFSKRLYKLRWRIETAFNRLKDFRRLAAERARNEISPLRIGDADALGARHPASVFIDCVI